MLSEFQERNSKKVKPIQVDYRHNVVRFKLEREIFSADKKFFFTKFPTKSQQDFMKKFLILCLNIHFACKRKLDKEWRQNIHQENIENTSQEQQNEKKLPLGQHLCFSIQKRYFPHKNREKMSNSVRWYFFAEKLEKSKKVI